MILPAENTCVAKNNRVVVLLISITFPETIFLWIPFLLLGLQVMCSSFQPFCFDCFYCVNFYLTGSSPSPGFSVLVNDNHCLHQRVSCPLISKKVSPAFPVYFQTLTLRVTCLLPVLQVTPQLLSVDFFFVSIITALGC